MGLFKKSGGGFLNGVEGVITAISFQSKEFISKKTKEPFHKLSAELLVTVDGADEPVQQFVDAGFFYPDSMAISDDGKTLLGVNDDGETVDLEESPLREGTEFEKLITSLIEGGFSEELLGIGVNYEPVEGVRVRFKRVVDTEGTKQFGKRKGKDGKEYNRDFLLIDAVLGMPEAKGKGKKATASAKPAAKTTAKPAASKKAAAADTDAVDEALIALVADGPVERKSLGSAFVRYALANKISQDDRKAIQAQLTSEEYLTGAEERGLITLDGKTVTAA